ncbi:hypothetical protein Cci01nite_27650 [Catellatospora citrea]|uniref:Uncharacterized protein n=1 Tax=Catellatospora citrea TaxID=53366 RepID=A0A8J3K6P5_9ACTN|nr:hypothetical protein Cci01nite_27650 [Catellatospora citrea]
MPRDPNHQEECSNLTPDHIATCLRLVVSGQDGSSEWEGTHHRIAAQQAPSRSVEPDRVSHAPALSVPSMWPR